MKTVSLRVPQIIAVAQIVDAFEDVDLVFLDGPTGTGKTVIAEMVRREMGLRGNYVCSDRALQDQFVRDFDDARVVKGRANYPTVTGGANVTCEDCTAEYANGRCLYCPAATECPYLVAKNAAVKADLAVLNMAYWLTISPTRAGQDFAKPLTIIDEADVLEDVLLGQVSFYVGEGTARQVGMGLPKKGARKTTLHTWLTQFAGAAARQAATMGAADAAKKRRWSRLATEARFIAGELLKDTDDGIDAEDGGRWVRTYEYQSALKLQPILVRHYGERIWGRGGKFLVMSATLISPAAMAYELGWDREFEVVSVDMTFPVANRPIVVAGVFDASKKGLTEGTTWDRMVFAVEAVLRKHPGERVLVHTGNYTIATELMARVQVPGWVKCSYRTAGEKDAALARYKAADQAVMFAPSMDRGVDLPGDLCTVQVIAKIPAPNLGDRRVSNRLRMPGGQEWYTTQTVRRIVQSTGRGVRGPTDTCVTYVLDAGFQMLWRNGRNLFPQWWRDAVDQRTDVRWLRWDSVTQTHNTAS